MNDKEIHAQILDRLAGLSCLTRDVSVEVQDGAVTLTGRVRTWFDWDEVERTVWAVPGVRAVDNRIAYTEGGATAEAELLP